jgi:hypothetical protein
LAGKSYPALFGMSAEAGFAVFQPITGYTSHEKKKKKTAIYRVGFF